MSSKRIWVLNTATDTARLVAVLCSNAWAPRFRSCRRFQPVSESECRELAQLGFSELLLGDVDRADEFQRRLALVGEALRGDEAGNPPPVSERGLVALERAPLAELERASRARLLGFA